ncbi:hypothetical protein GCM10022243_51160 [Saccharothrix violaceirubra]|uniref:Lipoprotein n=1 Tax=Saccharothrix violaceirubra TaxID=413306 RepID=A0A7W7WSY2_9PSEU|nr:hypothetical protein [Saccharothrix violaceirubra]MBB4962671.1 hypothetical protein [Saccharothrix violaceirubra]
MADKRGALAALCALLLTGCGPAVAGTPKPLTITDTERALVSGYFDNLNKAGTAGVDKQRELLRETQHPDFEDDDCELPEGTLRVVPTLATLRLDADWTPPEQDEHPRGVVFVVAVTLTLFQEGTEIGSQIGSQHVVLLNGRAYGFAPCITRK